MMSDGGYYSPTLVDQSPYCKDKAGNPCTSLKRDTSFVMDGAV